MSCYIISSKRSPVWCLCFQGRFNYWSPHTAFWHFSSLQTRRPCRHGPHSSYEGQGSAPQPSLHPDSRYPLQFREETSISRGFGATMMCLWASPSSFLSNESPSTASTFISHSLACDAPTANNTSYKNEHDQPEVTPQDRRNISSYFSHFVEVIWRRLLMNK